MGRERTLLHVHEPSVFLLRSLDFNSPMKKETFGFPEPPPVEVAQGVFSPRGRS